ncbi:MAG TPA: PAS domain S-box protein [Sediminispirochaeta sp.]|nr:PAS domain S-box protein [Sediminispirochaeta sp.]
MKSTASKQIEALKKGDHLCCIYQSEEEHEAVIRPFVLEGLTNKHKIIYIVDARTAETVVSKLSKNGEDIRGPLSRGQLVILDRSDTYTKNKIFDPDAMIELLEKETKKALEEGYRALRVTGEMSWALRNLPGTERLIEYENKLNEFMPRHSCMAICQYDRRVFDPAILLDVLRTHPIAIVGTKLYENFYYLPPEKLLGEDPQTAELDQWILNLQHRAEFERELQHERRFVEAMLESSEALIVILDTEGNVRRVNPACEQITGYDEEELRDLSVWRLVPEAEREETREVFGELLNGVYSNSHENNLISRSGEPRFIAWSNTVVKDAEGRMESIISTGLDITERKREDEEKIRQLEGEIKRLETYAAGNSTAATGRLYSQKPLREAEPADFERIMDDFGTIMEDRLEEKVFKVKKDTSSRLQSLSLSLGRAMAGPRDVVELYVKALREKSKDIPYKRPKH